MQAILAGHPLLKAVTKYKLVEAGQGRDGRQQESPAKFFTVPVDTKVEHNRNQPGTKTCFSTGIVFQQAFEAALGQLLTDE